MMLSDLALKRPIGSIVMSLIIILLGIVGYNFLGVRQYPNIDPPIITVQTSYTGANAEIIESQITEPIEKAINGIEGVKSVTSSSSVGSSTITVEFDLGADLEKAANDVRDKTSQAMRNLPVDIDAPPVVTKADANSDPIIMLVAQSNTMNAVQLSEYAENILQERFQTIPGISSVNIYGQQRPAMRLWLNPGKIAKTVPLAPYPKLFQVYEEAGHWLDRLGTRGAGALNDAVAAGTCRNGTISPDKLQEQGDGRIGVWARFDTRENNVVNVRVGVSLASLENARKYVAEQMPAADFAAVQTAARQAWNRTLGKINVEGGRPDDRRIFYTGLYHTLLQPRDRTGDNARWKSDEPFWDDHYAVWDTWRSALPLRMLIDQDAMRGIVRSMIDRHEHGGRVVRAARLMHGKTSPILHKGRGLFAGLDNPFEATRYHSLIVERESLPDVDVGFAFLPEFWRKGYAFESAAAVLDYGRDALHLNRIVAITDPTNEASARLLEKLGLQFERMITSEKGEQIKLFTPVQEVN